MRKDLWDYERMRASTFSCVFRCMIKGIEVLTGMATVLAMMLSWRFEDDGHIRADCVKVFA